MHYNKQYVINRNAPARHKSDAAKGKKGWASNQRHTNGILNFEETLMNEEANHGEQQQQQREKKIPI